MKKMLLTLLLSILCYNISYSVPTPLDQHTQYLVNAVRNMVAIKSTPGYSQQTIDSLENELRIYMQSQNYDSLELQFNSEDNRRDNCSDAQWGYLFKKQGITESVVKNYLTPTGDTNSMLIIWQDGLPRTGIKFDGLYKNIPPVIETITYFDASINPPAEDMVISPPDIYTDSIEMRNADSWQVNVLDICSGVSVIDTIFPAATNYFTETLENLGYGGVDLVYRILHPEEPSNIINISSLTAGLYFLTIKDMAINEVIYIKTINRNVAVIE